jgi:hypothetical protein
MRLIALTSVVICLLVTTANAQVTMDRVVIGSGGGTMTNGPLQMDLTIGHLAGGSLVGASAQGDLGFWWQVVPITTNVGPGAIPTEFALHQATPNPFSTRTSITYAIPRGPVPVFIGIFNLQGGLVRTLVQESQSPGTFTVTWDGRDANGLYAQAGVYFTKLRAGSFQRTAKTIMLK